MTRSGAPSAFGGRFRLKVARTRPLLPWWRRTFPQITRYFVPRLDVFAWWWKRTMRKEGEAKGEGGVSALRRRACRVGAPSARTNARRGGRETHLVDVGNALPKVEINIVLRPDALDAHERNVLVLVPAVRATALVANERRARVQPHGLRVRCATLQVLHDVLRCPASKCAARLRSEGKRAQRLALVLLQDRAERSGLRRRLLGEGRHVVDKGKPQEGATRARAGTANTRAN